VGSYSEAAEFYDLLYSDQKDYAEEAQVLAGLLRKNCPEAKSLLDVGCGTGAHARSLIDGGFEVDGIDLEPSFVEIAAKKCPEGSFHVGDMANFDLPGQYDGVLCLFSAIGYAQTEENLRAAIRAMTAHLKPGGVLLVDPWFEESELSDGWISTHVGRGDDLTVCRMSRTVIEGAVSRLEFEYLIGTSEGISRRSEIHELGLFSQPQMEAAFREAGLEVERETEAPRTRGIYVGRFAKVARTV